MSLACFVEQIIQNPVMSRTVFPSWKTFTYRGKAEILERYLIRSELSLKVQHIDISLGQQEGPSLVSTNHLCRNGGEGRSLSSRSGIIGHMPFLEASQIGNS